eukprot:9474400-Pyramimonas_sp.AAC.1
MLCFGSWLVAVQAPVAFPAPDLLFVLVINSSSSSASSSPSSMSSSYSSSSSSVHPLLLFRIHLYMKGGRVR